MAPIDNILLYSSRAQMLYSRQFFINEGITCSADRKQVLPSMPEE